MRWPEVFAIVRGHGFEGDDRTWIESIRARGHALSTSGPVALGVLVPQLPNHHEVADRPVRLRLEGHDVPFVTAEDLFVLKSLWWRPKDELDLAVLAEGTRGSLDVDYVREKVAALLPESDPRHAAIQTLLAPTE